MNGHLASRGEPTMSKTLLVFLSKGTLISRLLLGADSRLCLEYLLLDCLLFITNARNEGGHLLPGWKFKDYLRIGHCELDILNIEFELFPILVHY